MGVRAVIEIPDQALVLVDIQNDFLPGGALAVPDGDAVIDVATRLMARFEVVVATQDCHPSNHGSFASNRGAEAFTMGELGGSPQVMWPDHCVQGTAGAALAEALPMDGIDAVFPKGTDARIDSYSGFFDNDHARDTGLERWLNTRGIDHLIVLGLATDYCVKATVLDALELGFEVTVVEDGCRAVDMTPGDGAAALEEMRAAGARVMPAAVLMESETIGT